MDRGSLFLSCKLSKCTSRRQSRSHNCSAKFRWRSTWTEGRCSCRASCPSARRGDSQGLTTAAKDFACAAHGQRVRQSRSHNCTAKFRGRSTWTEGRCSCRAGCPSARRGDSRDLTTAVEDFAGAVHGQRVAAPVMQAVQMHVAETTWTESRSSCHAGCPKYTSRRQSRSHNCSEKIRWCSKWTEGRCSCHAGCPSTRRGDSRDLTTAVKKFAGAVNGQRVAVPVMQAVQVHVAETVEISPLQ